MEIGGGADEEEDDEKERLEVEERGLRGREAHAVSLEVYAGGPNCDLPWLLAGGERKEEKSDVWRVAVVRDESGCGGTGVRLSAIFEAVVAVVAADRGSL